MTEFYEDSRPIPSDAWRELERVASNLLSRADLVASLAALSQAHPSTATVRSRGALMTRAFWLLSTRTDRSSSKH